MPDGRVVLWCDKTSLTRDQLQNKLLGLGISDALMLDGGGSTQGRFPDGAVASSRKVATLLLFWQEAEAAAPENPVMKWAAEKGILTEAQLAEPGKTVTRQELLQSLYRLWQHI